VGLIWQFALAMIIVYREEGDLHLLTIRRRLRLNTPRDPKTGKSRGRLWLWLIPIIVLLAASQFIIAPALDGHHPTFHRNRVHWVPNPWARFGVGIGT
jgi:hypothetical protein